MTTVTATLEPSPVDSSEAPPTCYSNEEICAYYESMTGPYLRYGGEALAFHTGLCNPTTRTKTEALLLSNATLVEDCGIHAGLRILDAGCGIGGLAFYLAERYGAQVTGITICESHVASARDLARQKGLENLVEFRHLDFMEMDFPDDSFDIVLNQESFCYATDFRAYFREIHRILKPGGKWRALDVFQAKSSDVKMQGVLWKIQSGWKTPAFPHSKSISHALSESGFNDLISWDLSVMAHQAADSFIKEKFYRDLTTQFELSRMPHRVSLEPSFAAHLDACAAFGLAVLNGTLSYRLMGGTKM